MKIKLKIAAIIAFALVACVFFATEGNTQTKQVETAGQKFKNIKVLNDIPADQLGKVMNIMSASLGVHCNFCHVSNDGDFEKDGKKEKETARAMIKMTFELNKNHFDNKTEVTCATCHNGREHPNSAASLSPVNQEERPKQPEKKASEFDIIAKFETAIGGRANLDKIKSRQITANRIEPDGKTIEPEEIFQKSGKILISTKYPGYLVSEGFDGKTAWKKGNADEIVLKPDESEQIKREAQLFSGNLKDIYQKMDVRFLDRIDGKEAYMVSAITSDNVRERLYFDASNGFLIRRSTGAPTVLGFYVYQVDYSDYRDFGGVLLPTTVKYSMPGISWTRKILEVRNNVSIDEKRFVK